MEHQLVVGEYMFGILGYSTWNLYEGRTFIGQVTLNGPDNSAVWTAADEAPDCAKFYELRSFRWWMKWLKENHHDPF